MTSTAEMYGIAKRMPIINHKPNFQPVPPNCKLFQSRYDVTCAATNHQKLVPETDMSHFATRLHAAISQKQTPALVGLDPRFDQLPSAIVKQAKQKYSNQAALVAHAYESFCLKVIDIVAPLVPAVKPQAAFFEEWGPEGMYALCNVIAYARKAGLIVICDAKRGDIGSTAEAYARGWLGGENPEHPWQADALTVNPYLGVDTLEPFINVAVERGAGIYVLVRTSNPGSGIFQNKESDGQPLYRHVANEIEQLAQKTCAADHPYGCVGAVVGATYPQELTELRAAMPHTPLLVPGYDSQGGGASDVAAALDSDGLGGLINSSRGINFAYHKSPWKEDFGEENWEAAIEAATKAMVTNLRF